MDGPLTWIEAALRGDEQFLSANPALIDATTLAGWTVLHYAVNRGHEELVARLLVEAPHLIHATGMFGENMLQFATRHGHENIVAQLIVARPQLMDTIANPLHWVVRSGNEQVVRWLLATKPSLIDSLDEEGRFALHFAVSHDREAIADLLVEARPGLVFGADNFGANILGYISNGCRKEFVEKCLQWNPKALRQPDHNARTPFHYMIDKDNDTAVEVMQWKLSVDEIADAFAICRKSYEEGLWSIVTSRCEEGLLAYLIRDVVALVCEYVVTPPPCLEPLRKRLKL